MRNKAICIGGTQNLEFVVACNETFHTPVDECYHLGEFYAPDRFGKPELRKFWRLSSLSFQEARSIFENRHKQRPCH